MKNKKGFTLIEIIICITLIALIGTGTTVAVVSSINKKESDILVANDETFENALNIYLSNHGEILNNLYNNVEGAVVSLELLKNEGLIVDNLDINYKDNYFLLSDAVLVNNPEDGESNCSGRLSIATIKSWDLSKYEPSNVIYICPKEGSSITNIYNSSNIVSNGYIAKGKNPNNWVKFDVIPENNDWVWFPKDEEEDLWRIIRVTDEGNIKLIYNNHISVDQTNNPNIDIEEECKYKGKTFYNIQEENAYDWIKEDRSGWVDHYIFNNGMTYPDFLASSEKVHSMKSFILQDIENKDWIKEDVYYYGLSIPYLDNYKGILTYWIIKQDTSMNYSDKIGNLTLGEYRLSMDEYDQTYLNDNNLKTLIGISEFDRTLNRTEQYLTNIGDGDLVRTKTLKSEWIVRADGYSGSEDVIEYFSTNYNPVITLKSNITIKSYNNCSDGSIRGSKECPFELVET